MGIDYSTQSTNEDGFAEGLSFWSKKKEIVKFGRLTQKLTDAFDISTQVLYADFDWDVLLKLSAVNQFNANPIPKYPEVRRDFALLIDDAVTFEDIQNIAFKTDKKILQDVGLFDVYQGENLPDGKKSYAVSFTFRDMHKTLTDKQVDKLMAKLQKQFETQLEAELR